MVKNHLYKYFAVHFSPEWPLHNLLLNNVVVRVTDGQLARLF